MVEPLATVAPPNMQVEPEGMTWTGESPIVDGARGVFQVPSSQRNCVPF
jgi:hypothetical protein